MTHILIQPAPRIDHITDDGTPLTQKPYPILVDQDGNVDHQDFWQGKVLRIIGFQRSYDVQQIDLWWRDAFQDPQKMIGMYPVSTDADGGMGNHDTPVESFKILTGPAQDGQNRPASANKED
jgi:hypothetical protein